jgi:hypothetical protein
MPCYLLIAEDNLDKVDKSELQNCARTADDIIGTLMKMKKDIFTKIEMLANSSTNAPPSHF